ncbi:hypothetical protein TruAng_004902 [Truncatella angustata]|nr:hypothetical protein TruAng_004902 [Truncatella angustata]
MAYPTIPPSSCSSGVIPTPFLFGAEIISLAASPILNFTGVAPEKYYYNHPTVVANQVNFCSITVTYTHPGQNDVVNIETWLPLDTWNGRLQAVGGCGWTLGRFPLSTMAMTGAIGQGYVTTTTDAGIRGKDGQAAYAPDDWVLVSEGNINLHNVQTFASVSLNDQAIIANALIKSFYGQGPEYSYWSGCSQGGRQGMMLAQRYPHAYDGIAAAAPAINVLELFADTIWAQVTMLDPGSILPLANLILTSADISFCDPLDGIIDGLILDELLCQFDPMALVGESFICSDTNKTITLGETAAVVAKAAWTGPRSPNGDFIWYGPNMDSRLSGEVNGPIVTQADMGYAQTYQSILGSNDPDLSEFHAGGGKIITYHGMARLFWFFE